jgi:hypothetical protein
MAVECEVCEGPIPAAASGRGRPRAYCSRACQAKAHRARIAEHPRAYAKTGPADVPAPYDRLFTPARTLADILWRDVLTLVRAADPRSTIDAATVAATAAAARQGLADLIAAAQRRCDEKDVAVTKSGPVDQPGDPDLVTDPAADEDLGGVGEALDRDALFDAFDALQEALRGDLQGELGAALEGAGGAFLIAWDGQAGDGALADLIATAREVLDGLADYRHAPTTPADLLAAADQLAPLLEAAGAPAAPEPAAAPVTAEVTDLYLAGLTYEADLVLADGARVGWIHRGDDGRRVHSPTGEVVAFFPAAGGMPAAAQVAAALGLRFGEHTTVTTGSLTDHNGRSAETSPQSLAAWSLLRGRVPGREDIIVRGRCVGWLQPHPSGGYIACGLDGPVTTTATHGREVAVVGLFRALYAPVPLPDLGPGALAKRKPKARPRTERPICPYTEGELAAAATTLPTRPDAGGTYPVVIDGELLGRVYRSGRHWYADPPTGRTLVRQADTRTQAVDRLLATPGPLWGDPADTVVHDLSDS